MDQLPSFVASDPYMKEWKDTIMADPQKWQAMDPVPYDIDGGWGKSGVLDVARQVKQRIKAFAYAYRIIKETMWVDRVWKELYRNIRDICGHSTHMFRIWGGRVRPNYLLFSIKYGSLCMYLSIST